MCSHGKDFNPLMEAMSLVLFEAVKHALNRIDPGLAVGGRSSGPLLLTPKEAAKFLAMGQTTLRDRRRAGLIKPVDENGRTMYRRGDLEVYAQKLKILE